MRMHNRIIKAAFWTDTELIRHLDRDGRMFYIGLIQLADDSGCLEDDLLAFKIHLYPADLDVDLDFLQRYRDKLIELGKLIPHPEGRYIVLEFQGRSGKFREAFWPEEIMKVI